MENDETFQLRFLRLYQKPSIKNRLWNQIQWHPQKYPEVKWKLINFNFTFLDRSLIGLSSSLEEMILRWGILKYRISKSAEHWNRYLFAQILNPTRKRFSIPRCTLHINPLYWQHVNIQNVIYVHCSNSPSTYGIGTVYHIHMRP